MRISPANQYASLYGLNRMRTSYAAGMGRNSYLKGTSGSYQKSYAGSVSQVSSQAAGFRRIAEKLQDADWDKEYRLSGKKTLQNGVRTFVEEYNKLYSQARNVSSNTGTTYGVQFRELVNENQKSLLDIGIESDGDGKLSINNAKLKKAKAADLKEVFSGSDSLAGKAAVKSIYAEAQVLSKNMAGTYGYGLGGLYGSYGLYGMGSYGTYGAGLGLYGSYPYTGRYLDMLL